MKSRPRPRTKAEDVPAPSKSQFEGFMKRLVAVSKEELDRREADYQRSRKKKS